MEKSCEYLGENTKYKDSFWFYMIRRFALQMQQ